MKTSLNKGEVSLPPAQPDIGGQKLGAEHGYGAEKQGFGVENWLDRPSEGRISRKRPGKLNLPHEHQVKWEIPVNI